MFYYYQQENRVFDIEFAIDLLLSLEGLDMTKFKSIAGAEDITDVEISRNIGFHLQKLSEAGFLRLKIPNTESNMQRIFFAELTYEGHEFISEIKNQKIRTHVFDLLKSKGDTISINAFRDLVKKVTKEYFSNY